MLNRSSSGTMPNQLQGQVAASLVNAGGHFDCATGVNVNMYDYTCLFTTPEGQIVRNHHYMDKEVYWQQLFKAKTVP